MRKASFVPVAILAILLSGIVGVVLFRVAADQKPTSVVGKPLSVVRKPPSVLLQWNPPPRPAFIVAGYNVYRSSSDGDDQKIAAGVTAPTYTDHDVKSGKTYEYYVRAMDAAGHESPRSNQAMTTIP